MQNILEYAILGIAIICLTVLMAIRVLPAQDGLGAITVIVGYVFGVVRTKTLTSSQAKEISSALSKINPTGRSNNPVG